MNVLAHIDSKTWAIMPAELDRMRSIVSSEGPRIDGLIQQRMSAPEAARYSERQASVPTPNESGVAVVQISGPIMNVTSWLDDVIMDIFGGTSLQGLQKQIDALKDNSAITAVILHIHSPGGDVFGTNETANKIAELSVKKPTVAYAYGCCASAAYFLAAKCREIVADKQAWLGSIGVVRTWVDFTGFYEMNGVAFEEVTSQHAPYKRLDIRKPEERAVFMSEINGIESVFHESVAKGRKVPIETVRSSFGLGAVMAGHEAVKAGLADRIGSFDQVVKELSSKRKTASASADAEGDFDMGFKDEFKAFASKLGFNVSEEAGEAAGEDPVAADTAADAEAAAVPANSSAESASPATDDTSAEAAASATAQVEAVNLKLAQTEASAFVAAEIQSGRMVPAEKASMESLYVHAATDDRISPLASGSRVETLKAMQAARKPHGLTEEVVNAEANQVLLTGGEREVSDERTKQLLQSTPLGKRSLELVKSANS